MAEGEKIDIDVPDRQELAVEPKKLAGLTVVSNELASDSDPSAMEVVGQGLARDLQLRLGSAFFGNTVTNGPSGLLSLNDFQEVDAASITNLAHSPKR
jgi:HK97 family phage major capsid protein